jgi:hypothetical protein
MSVGTCPADCPLAANVKHEGHHLPAYSLHSCRVGKYCDDRVTLLLYFIFCFGMGGKGSKKVPTTSAISICLPEEILERTN